MPCQLSYAATRVVTLLAAQSIAAAIDAQQEAVPGSIPTNWASTILAIKAEGAVIYTDPKTGKPYSAEAREVIYGNGSLADMVVSAGGAALVYFAQDDKPGGPAKVL